MRDSQKNTLIAVISGIVACIVCVGVMFTFPTNKSNLKGNETKLPNNSNSEIKLGDEGDECTTTTTYTCDGAAADLIGSKCYTEPSGGNPTSTDCDGYGEGIYIGGQCYKGSYNATPHQNTTCTSCRYGKYLNGTSCELCHAGYECPDGINMVACPPGKYSEAEGQVGCASCANLDDGRVRVQPASGQTSCIRCEGDKIANANHTQCVADATNCDNGQYSANGECHDCPPGKYCNGTGAIDCPIGTYAAVTGKRTSCSLCNGTNQYQDQYGQTQCKTCVGEVNEAHTVCTPTCSSKTTQSDCGTLEGCAWVNDQCIYKPACSTFNDKTTCEARSDCAWDTTWTTYCHNKPNTVVSVTASTNNVYVAVDYPVEVTFTATDANGQPINVSWSAGTNNVTKNCGATASSCTYTFNSHGCGSYSFQATGTDVGGGSATSKKVSAITYTAWGNGSERTSSTRPTEKTRESLKYKVGCEAIENIRENNGQYTYTVYNRCCGGGTTYSFCCVKNDGSGQSWLTGKTSKTCPDGYHIDETRNAGTCTKTFACYMDSDNQPHWTSDPESSWVIVSKPEQECKDQEACFEDPTGQRFWGKHYNQIAQGYILITSIKDEDSCKNPSDNDACYMSDIDETDYVWAKTAPSGYTKVDNINSAKECQPEACYIEKDKNEFAFGKYKDNDKYIPVYKTIEVDGEYKDVLIIDKNECTTEVPVGPTDFDVTKLVYVFMAILMACGVAFIYYSSVAKKQNQ